MNESAGLALKERDVTPIAIEEELKSSYLDYAMSVIVSRALPDVRDGLKPVHRRILYACHESGYEWNKPTRKSARIVGDVMGKYHPHGDSSIYDALVRMAQDFSLRLPLIDGQGNFGSMDGDPPAAMRYTEARMAKAATALLADIDKDTVAFQDNYDGSEREPVVLPARFPNILVNGAGGIAVGMATNIPPHNLTEVLDACLAFIDNPSLSSEDLMEFVKGPDFPTGGIILGTHGIRDACLSGRGSIVIRSRTHVEEVRKERQAIVITEVPYQVNKATLQEKIAECVKDKRIEGISDIRDESSREGLRVVIELKRDAEPEVVLNQLYRYTQVQTSFGVNTLALNGGKPQQMALRDIIDSFVRFREEVITRRTRYDLGKARERAHICVGLVTAVSNLDKVVAIIRGSSSPSDAREKMMTAAFEAADILPYLELIRDPRDRLEGSVYRLSEEQVKAILELRLHRLTALGRDDIAAELKELAVKIEELLSILRDRARMLDVMRSEFLEVREAFGTPRRTEIAAYEGDVDDEDLIQREDMIVTVTTSGYIKRVPLDSYRAQRRGGKGRSGMTTKDEDVLSNIFVASTHTPVLFFTTRGQVYKMKVWKLPVGTPQSKGKALINMLPIEQGEAISAILPLPEDEAAWENLHIMFATAHGNVRRNLLSDFSNVRSSGKIAIRFDSETDELVGVATCGEGDDVLLAAKSGQCIRFNVSDVRVFVGRTSTGVRGMRLAKDDKVISMSILTGFDATTEERDAYLRSAPWKQDAPGPELAPERMAAMAAHEQFILTVTANGYGKRSSSYEYRTTGRGGSGIRNMDISNLERSGHVIASFPIGADEQVVMITDQGKIIRTPVSDVRVMGRATQGVTLFRVTEEEHVVSVAKVADEGEDEDGDGVESSDGE